MKAVLMLLALLMLGCTPDPKIVTVEKVVNHYPPDSLLITCTVAIPPEAEYYASQPAAKKEELLIDAFTTQYNYVEICNTRINGLKAWKKKLQDKENKELKETK